MKTRKKILIGLTALVLGCTVSAVTLTNVDFKEAKADSETFAMVNGASVRLDTEEYGLRFSAEIGDSYTEKENVSYNMMIIPANWITKYNLSGDGFNGNYMTTLREKLQDEASNGKGLGEDGSTPRTIATVKCTPYLNTVATGSFKANTYYISGSITSIKYGNINGDFFGLAYTVDNKGTEDTTDDEYKYASFENGENVRNVVYVASSSYMANEFKDGSTEKNIISALVTQGLNKAAGIDEANKNDTYTFNPSMDSTKYVLKSNTHQFVVTGIPQNVDLKEVWSSSNPSVATIDGDGLLTTGATAGSTTITYKVLDKTLTCLVNVGDKQVDYKELGDFVLNSSTVSNVDFVQSVEGEVTEVTITDGTTSKTTTLETTAYSVADGKLTIPYDTIKAYYGANKTIKATTANKDYIWTANIVTLSISDASQFIPDATTKLNALQTAGGLTTENLNSYIATYTGYFVLANDIDFNGAEVNVSSQYKGLNNITANAGLVGIFEGNGHTLSNFKVNGGSLFGGIANGGTLKNLNIRKASVGSSAIGLFGYYMFGTYNNLFVDVQTAKASVLAKQPQYDTQMTNCTFVIYAADDVTGYLLVSCSDSNKVRKLTATNTTVVTNKNENEMWSVTTINSDISVKGFKTHSINLNEDAKLSFEGATEVWLDGNNITNSVTIAGSEIQISFDAIANSPSKCVIISNASNIEVYQVSVVLTEVSETKEFSLYTTSKNSETNEITWSSSAFAYDIQGTPVSATIGGEDASSFLSPGKFEIPADKVPDYYGEKTVYIETTSHKYTLNVTFATLFITDAYQLATYKNNHSVIQYIGGLTVEKYGDGKNQYNEGTTTTNTSIIADSRYYGYFVLANDIDFDGAEIAIAVSQKAGTATAGRECGFTGTFDGKGHTLSNFSVKGGYSFFGSVAKSSTIKDLNFKKVTISASASGIMGYGGGTWNNVYFEISSAKKAVFGNPTSDVVTLNNCVFVVNADTTLTSNVIFSGVTYAKCTKLNNVTVISNATTTPFNGVNGSNPGNDSKNSTCAPNGFNNVNVYTATFADGETITATDIADVYLDGVKLTKDTDYTVSEGNVTLLTAMSGTHTVCVVGATKENTATKINEGSAMVYTVTVE